MKFRRKSVPQQESTEETAADGPTEAGASGEAASATPSAPAGDGPRSDGPWDSSEVSLADEDPARVDLGGLLVTGGPGLELRLQVDEASQQVVAVLLVGTDGAVELRPFAAPRNEDIWGDIRKQIAAETARRGGTATEADGPYGKELRVMMPVAGPDGKSGTQPSRVLGITGPRWLLRATFLGRPALEPDRDGVIESALRSVVVVRGASPMAPGDPLPLTMPAQAAPLEQPTAPPDEE